MGYGLEVELIRAAHQQDLLTTPYVFDADAGGGDGRGRRRHRRAAHGPDHRRRHRRRRPRSRSQDCPALIDAMAEAARAVRKDVIVLCHGGPIATPEDAAYILQPRPALPRLLRRLARWSGCRPRWR